MNVLFFIGTVYYLVDHWRKAAGVINSQVVEIPIWNKYSFQPFAYCPKQSLRAQVRSNFLIVLKLFFIMGTFHALIYRNNLRLLLFKLSAGIPWMLEFASQLITHNRWGGKINQNHNWKMAIRGKSIKITIESLDGCEKERSTKINIEKLKNGKLGDQHIRSATGCCWTSQISSRQVYQLILFR